MFILKFIFNIELWGKNEVEKLEPMIDIWSIDTHLLLLNIETSEDYKQQEEELPYKNRNFRANNYSGTVMEKTERASSSIDWQNYKMNTKLCK